MDFLAARLLGAATERGHIMELVKSPIFEGISWAERLCMRDCFGMREQNFRPEEVVYEFDALGGIIGILTEGTAVLERIDENGSRTIQYSCSTGAGNMWVLQYHLGSGGRVDRITHYYQP